MAEQTFDPRFDPAFQRGYKPPAKPQSVPAVPLPVGSIGEPPAGPDPKAPDPNSPEGAATEDAVPKDVAMVNVATEAVAIIGRRGVNPYVIILWVVGAVFVLGGAAVLFGSHLLLFTNSAGAPSQNAAAQALYVFGTVFGAPAATVGLATIAALVFFSAWRSWQRSKSTNS